MQRKDLAKLQWTLSGWEPNAWRLRRSMELDIHLHPEIGPCPARVPGSVQAALLAAGLLPDWNQGLNVYACEWTEHRHWEFSTQLPANWFKLAQAARLRCQGLDYSGRILIDAVEVAAFSGALLPHEFDLTPHLTPGRAHHLSIMLEGAPREQNQFGFTSQSQFFKPRFAYRWDWCPRFVCLGVWDSIELELGDKPALQLIRPQAMLAEDLKTGALTAECHLRSAQAQAVTLSATLAQGKRTLGSVQRKLKVMPGETTTSLKLRELAVEPWFPNGAGAQPLYDLRVELCAADGDPLDAWHGQVGFKRVRWLPCEDAPRDALPWLCEINGRKLFLQGVNWTPIRPNYHDLTPADYTRRVKTYAGMGCNFLRVWGGGLIERRHFYEECDRLGLLVWQEFPLSSSGIDNTPPSDPQAIATLVQIAESAILRRDGHVSLLQWCGGNELQSTDRREVAGCGWPWDETHPCLKALGDTVRRLKSPARFLPTSPFGPSFMFDPARRGEGRHHAVHGPWIVEGTMADWRRYWDQDEALFRPETGCPGASPLDLLEQYHGDQPLWPPSAENHYWRYPGAWWAQWERFKPLIHAKTKRAQVAEYIRLSQRHQAEALTYALRRCKGRFPRCGGFIIWMGHDCFPCTANTSLLDFHGRRKPAAKALARLFKQPA
jgi:beta-mannosidase